MGLDACLGGAPSVLFPGVPDSLRPVEGCLIDLTEELFPYCSTLAGITSEQRWIFTMKAGGASLSCTVKSPPLQSPL